MKFTVSAAYLAVCCVFFSLIIYFISTQLSKILVFKLASFAAILFFMFVAGHRVAGFPGTKKVKRTFKRSKKKPNSKIEAGSWALVIFGLFASDCLPNYSKLGK